MTQAFYEAIKENLDAGFPLWKVRAASAEDARLHVAVQMASKEAPATLEEVYEALLPEDKAQYVSSEPNTHPLLKLHWDLARMVIEYRSIVRTPTVAAMRESGVSLYDAGQDDVQMYRYTAAPVRPLSPGTVHLHLQCLSAIWNEFLLESGYVGSVDVLVRNPWKPVAEEAARVNREWHRRRADKPSLSHQLIDAIFLAARGKGLVAKRNRLVLCMATFMGLRSEEIVGAQRRDLTSQDGILSLDVKSGKGDKYRRVPLSPQVRYALHEFEDVLKRCARSYKIGPGRTNVPTRKARYAYGLLMRPEAPVVPAIKRKGINSRTTDPSIAALEPLNTSGLSAIFYRLSKIATVWDIEAGKTRSLTREERAAVHPHAFRHYAATAAYEGGLPLEEIRVLLGHDTIKTTEGYVKVGSGFITQLGAYIGKAREGSRVTEEEADALRRRSRSVLQDPTIAPVEPKDLQLGRETPPTEGEILSARVLSPDWAYAEPDRDPTELYLPDRSMRPGNIPKGVGLAITFRIGKFSRMPWWAGHANRWRRADYAPILSRYQIQPESSEHRQILEGLQAMYERAWNENGPTAASALTRWISEIVGVASLGFEYVMTRRDDKWVGYDQPSAPLDHGIVREHRPEAILWWFQTHGLAISQTAPRRSKAPWRTFPDPVTSPSASSFSVSHIENNAETFRPGAILRWTGLVRKALTTFDWHHGTVRSYDNGIITIDGDQILQSDLRVLQTAPKPEAEGQPLSYPALVAMRDLPEWFFDEDPILSLGEEERKRLRLWIEQLQGIRPSPIREAVAIDDIVGFLELWGTYAREGMLSVGDEQRFAIQALEQIDARLKKEGKQRFGVPIVAADILGKEAERTLREVEADRVAKSQGPEPLRDEQGGSIDLKSRLVLYLLHRGVDISAPGVTVMEPVLRSPSRLFDRKMFKFDSQHTIVHPQSYREEFFARYGTDSECVARRVSRYLWERHKSREEAESPEHHEMVRRHLYAWLSFAVPCPRAIEDRLRQLGRQPEAGTEVAAAVRKAWGSALDAISAEMGLLAPEAVEDPELAEDLRSKLGRQAEILAEFTSFSEQEIAKPTRAKPNAPALWEAVPDPISLLFAEKWVV